MIDLLKKSLAFGVGAALLTTDKVKQMVDEAVDRGEMNQSDAQKFIDDVAHRAEQEKNSVQDWIRQQMTDMGLADSSRVQTLENRIAALELRLAAAEKKDSGDVKELI